VQRNRNPQLRQRALAEIAARRDPEAFDEAIEIVGGWSREERREGARTLLQALAERRIGRRDQAQAWLWRLAEYSRDVHEEYAVQRWPETKRLLGLLVNSSGAAHGRNARRLVHAARKQDRRLASALLAAALAHTPEAEEVLRGARNRMARKPSAIARELVKNFPKGKKRRSKSTRTGRGGAAQTKKAVAARSRSNNGRVKAKDTELEALEAVDSPDTGELLTPEEAAALSNGQDGSTDEEAA
jgi:ribonuclease E